MKKFLAVALAIALVITGLYPSQWAKAATTTQGDGLNFQNASPWLYSNMDGYYKAESVHSSLPKGFEATIRIPTGEGVFGGDDRVIFSNGAVGGTTAGTVEFGVTKDTYLPKLAVVDASGTRTEYTIQPSGDVTTLQTGEWLHLAIAADSASGKISAYVNGELFGSVEGTIPEMTPAKAFCIAGDYSWTNTSTFMGDIKNVAVWSDLTADAVATHAANNGVVSAGETGLMSAYNLDLEENGTYPDKLIDVNGIVDFVSTTAKFITEEEAVALSKRPENYDFSMVVIGDQQVPTAYTAQDAVRVAGLETGKPGREWYPDQKVDKVFQWVVDNVESKNIKFAFNMGDIVDNYSQNSDIQNAQEWVEGARALKLLNGKVPYSIVRGNHDGDTEFNQNFPLSEMKNKVQTELVSFDGTTMNTTYQKFIAGGIKYMVVNLDFGVAAANTNGNEIIAWANQIVEDNPDYNVIVATHGYLGADGVRLSTETHGNGGMTNEYYSRAKSGEDIWNEFVKLHENIVMVLSGHVGSDGIVKSEDTGVNGNTVIELCVNAQDLDVQMQAEGNYLAGNVAMLYFSEGGTKVTVENYSTLRDQYYNPANQFTMTLNRIGEGQTYDLDNGAVAVPYNMVDTTGDVPTYEDYLFAGWYTSPGCTLATAITDSSKVTDTSYAKFIPADILTVKAQVSTSTISSGAHAGNWAMRFVSSVESGNYKNVGFKVTDGSEVFTSSEAHVYSKISSTDKEIAYNFSPQVISKNSEYFFTAKLAVTEDAVATDYTVQAFVETFDGTIVYGPKRVVAANDGLTGTTINMVIKEDLTGTDYTATYTTDNTAATMSDSVAVTVLPSDAGYTNIRIPVSQGLGELFSASKVVISDANGVVATDVYRNYYANHGRAYQDISWYYADSSANEFVLASSSDLYGWEAMAYKGVYFEGKTIQLVSDVVINEGTAVAGEGSAAPSWSDDDETIHKWVPIGRFNGTFDGNGNTVSGVYIDNTAEKTGFFKELYPEAKVMNFGIINSYIKSNNKDYAGALAGHSYAKLIKNVYSDAVIDCGNCTGGLIGMVEPYPADTEMVLEQCWFDGEIYVSGYGGTGGGLVGYIYDADGGKIRFTDCMFSGDLYEYGTYSYPNYGGILGSNRGANAGTTLTFQNCLNVGTMASTHSTGGFGAIVAYANAGYVSSKGYNCWSVESSAYTYNCPSGGELQFSNSGIITREELLLATDEELFVKLPLLSGQSASSWMCDPASNDTDRGTPILKGFANVWMASQPAGAYDTRWYDAEATEYTISTKEDLYGLAQLSADTNFEGKTIKLEADIYLNQGNAEDWATKAPANAWTPIAEFAGTLDGQGHIISGLYIEGTTTNTGLFRVLTETAEVCNLGIVNSYITNPDNDTTGSLAGVSSAKLIKNVYSDAIINGGNLTGGIVGIAQPTSADTELVFEQCWFDGKADVTGWGGAAGGIAGYMWDNVSGKIRFTDCLFSGELNDKGTASYPNWGGIVGPDHGSQSGSTTVTFENCLNTGIMTSAEHGTGGFGGIAAYMNKGLTASTGTNCYAVSGSAYSSVCPSGGELSFTNYGVVDRATLLCATQAELLAKLPLLSGQSESAWMCNTSGGETGTPILKGFANVWAR